MPARGQVEDGDPDDGNSAMSPLARPNLNIDSIDSAFTDTLARTIQPATTELWIRERP